MTEPAPVLTQNLENVDRILDELDDYARSDLPTPRFFQIVLERLKISVLAKSVAILLPVEGKAWLPIASVGGSDAFVPEDFFKQLALDRSASANFQTGVCAGCSWVAVPLRPSKFSKGCLAICFEPPTAASSLASFAEFASAFAEIIAQRQTLELESFLDSYWERTQELCRQIASSMETQEADCLLVNGLAHTLNAARVTLVSMRITRGPQVRAISGAPLTQGPTRLMHVLRRLGQQVCQSGEPLWKQQSPADLSQGEPALPEISEDGTFANLVCIPFASTLNRPKATAIVFEFQSPAELIASVSKLPQLLPTLSVTWDQHTRWLTLPRFVRNIFIKQSSASTLIRRGLKWLALIGFVCLAIWGLRRPSPLIVEAEGSYEPVVTRLIYATTDGFIDRLLIEDGAPVEMGQPLALLRSPTLELSIQEASGEIRSIDEEIASMRIAMNQVDPQSSELVNDQRRLASKIALLETQQQSVRQRLELLNRQETRLTLLSPIRGVIDAKDLQQHLEQRPVRRGDPLFSVVDLDGPWQIRVNVPDRDSGYVLRNYAPITNANGQPTPHFAVDFVLDSSPASRFRGEVTWIADHVENLHGEGCYVEVRAATEKSVSENAHAGAGVHAYFECGDQPLWFVWCRPLVEAAQRRLWFRSQND